MFHHGIMNCLAAISARSGHLCGPRNITADAAKNRTHHFTHSCGLLGGGELEPRVRDTDVATRCLEYANGL